MKKKTTKKRDKKSIIMSVALAAAIIVICALLLKQCGYAPNVFSGILMDESQQDIHDDKKNNAGADYISFPGYSKIKVDKNDLNVQLKNPAENTVNFVYTITKDVSAGEPVFTGTKEEASSYIASNEKKYTNENQGNECVFKDDEGNTYKEIDAYKMQGSGDQDVKVIKYKKQMVYFTKGIAPGKSVDWKIKQYVTSDTDVNINISTYDTVSNAPCVGTNISTKIIFI